MPERFGRYELLSRLGVGGMGEVFLARTHGDATLDSVLVVKTLLPALAEDEDVVKMFVGEAKLAAQLDHPNICKVLDLGLESGVLFMALEYIRGADGDKLTRTAGGPLPVPLATRIIADAARGLDHAHQLKDEEGNLVGLIHRDVSPHNLIVTFDGRVKVIDFGLAKTVGVAQASNTGSLKGKFAYMAPEQVRAERFDLRIDVFALGICLWELLAGEKLFRKDNDIMTLAAIAQCEVEPPSTRNPAIPPDLDAIVLKALAKERAKRFQSAREFAEALEAFGARVGGATTQALGAWMRTTFREHLEEERRKGAIAGTTEGPLMRLHGLGGLERKPEPPKARGPAVINPDLTNPGAPIPGDNDSTQEAAVDEDGVPVAKGGVRLAARPEPARGPSLASVPAPRFGAAPTPARAVERFQTIEAAGDEPTIPTRAPLDAPATPRTKSSPTTAPLAAVPRPARPPQMTTVPLAPAYHAPPVAQPVNRTWLWVGIGAAALVVVLGAVAVIVLD